MERQQIDDELSTTGARELLASTSWGHLACIAQDETPRVVPVGFFWTGEQFVVATATTAPKVKALSARPAVALAIDAGETPDQARALSVRGRASVEIVDGVVEEYLSAARQAMDAEAVAEFERNVRGMYDQMARIAITPHWVRYYDFGAGRVPRFLQDLAERNQTLGDPALD
ncbi:pyridoxamine 5'-phosphate oxidase family protein [Mycobacterium sp.]|uniref:pyridoxamine 5'-phosphate oxidase family protein n=1 Tax=Mycobacterium sp. TaxID=1785 RepID=UPI002C56AC27|nr:pyridoxamine 5'-phosphate oxidase family protein [Mycobacterium sp.]HTY33852.1 pyridoxamine 5'-phosphate oxidase family protein [Mycobacterium sp.]